MTDLDVLEYFIKSNGHINISRLMNIPDEYNTYLLARYVDSMSLQETIKRIQLGIEIRPVCEICGKPVTYIGKKNRTFTLTCSSECANKLNSINVSKAFANMSNIKKQEIVNKVKQTKLLKYGDENFCNVEKIKETCLLRYGVEHALQSDVFKEKSKETCLQKYGVEYTGLILSKKDKTKNTWLLKYGVANIFLSPYIKEKALNTSILKYACENDHDITNVFLLCYVKNKIKNTNIQRYGVDVVSKNSNIKMKLSQILSSDDVLNKIYETKKKNKSFNISKQEDECYRLIIEKYPDCKRLYKSDLYPYTCDFYIPSEDLYIEYNGSHYHHYHPYDSINENDVKELNNLIEHSNKLKLNNANKKNLYDYIIYTWSQLDVNKRNLAKTNKLNYIEFWNINEVKKWLE